jgi:hypothetical protein
VQALEKAAADESSAVHHRSHAWSVFILAASAVLREGIESIIFLAGVCVGGGGGGVLCKLWLPVCVIKLGGLRGRSTPSCKQIIPTTAGTSTILQLHRAQCDQYNMTHVLEYRT